MMMAGAAYGIVTPLVKIGIAHGVPVIWLTLAQYPVSLIIFLIGIVARRHPGPHPTMRDYAAMGAVGAAGAGVSLTYYHSLAYLPGSVGIVLLFQFAWALPLLSGLVHHRWPSHSQWYGVLIVVGGTMLAAGVHSWHFPLAGIGLGFTAAILYSLSLLFSGHLNPAISPWYRQKSRPPAVWPS